MKFFIVQCRKGFLTDGKKDITEIIQYEKYEQKNIKMQKIFTPCSLKERTQYLAQEKQNQY